MRKTKSSILAAVHDTAKGLQKAGVMDQVTLREFDQLCLPPVEPLQPEQIKPERARTAGYLRLGVVRGDAVAVHRTVQRDRGNTGAVWGEHVGNLRGILDVGRTFIVDHEIETFGVVGIVETRERRARGLVRRRW